MWMTLLIADIKSEINKIIIFKIKKKNKNFF